MATLYDVPAEDLIEAVAADLAERIEEPEWADLTKNGVHNEMPPQQDDFWHVRAASVLRKLATDGPVGVDRLATEYGGGKRGSNRYRVSPRKRSNGSKKVIRTICQQLEDEDLVKQAGSEGRTVTGDGRSLLDDVAGEVLSDLDRPDLERYA